MAGGLAEWVAILVALIAAGAAIVGPILVRRSEVEQARLLAIKTAQDCAEEAANTSVASRRQIDESYRGLIGDLNAEIVRLQQEASNLRNEMIRLQLMLEHNGIQTREDRRQIPTAREIEQGGG